MDNRVVQIPTVIFVRGGKNLVVLPKPNAKALHKRLHEFLKAPDGSSGSTSVPPTNVLSIAPMPGLVRLIFIYGFFTL